MARRPVASMLVALGLVAAGAVVAASGARPGAEGQRADEYRVKAAFLFNFAKFVEWPATAFAAPAAPLNVCILGVDPFGHALDDTLRGRLVSGRSLAVRRIAEVEAGCHLLFISGSERRRLAVLTDEVRTGGVLTVSEEEGFTAMGGMIELVTAGESIQFNISPASIERAGLHASARLIALAANQRHGSGGRR
ncbi:MAG: YfiR family protein [Vicinamibacterales bacterium]